MPLSVNFTDAETDTIRQMCRLANTPSNVADLVPRLDGLNPAQVILTQTDIAEWKKVQYGTEKSKGGIKGTDYDTERNRIHIRDLVRERLGYPQLPSPLGADQIGMFGVSLPGWFGGGCPDEYAHPECSSD